jgi:two-component system response regulator YesN
VEKVFLWLLTIGNSYIDLLTEKTSDESDLVINRALTYIQQNYSSQGLSLKEVAGAIYVSPPYLSRLFKKRKGYNLTEHINRVRIEQAKQLLQQPESKIAEVATLVGFADRSYFCKVFKQLVGVSPNEYKKKSWL